MKTLKEVLEENGFDIDKFELENEYSSKNLIEGIEKYAMIEIDAHSERIKDRMYRRGLTIPWINDIVDGTKKFLNPRIK